MAIVNFSIPETLESRVNDAVKAGGYASKAEFFRFAAMNLLDKKENKKDDERTFPDPEIDRLADELGEVMHKAIDFDNLPSSEEQFAAFNKKHNIKL
jgi:Arc/MetJ-type ribon-helix-helix transcriptional regulator